MVDVVVKSHMAYLMGGMCLMVKCLFRAGDGCVVKSHMSHLRSGQVLSLIGFNEVVRLFVSGRDIDGVLGWAIHLSMDDLAIYLSTSTKNYWLVYGECVSFHLRCIG